MFVSFYKQQNSKLIIILPFNATYAVEKAIKYGTTHDILKIYYIREKYTLLSCYPVRGVFDMNFINI
jgi:hypothetical protein